MTPIRAELGFRTVFNLLGPLANPAGARRQLLGVYDAAWVEPLAEVLCALGAEHAWVVHGAGLDEIATTGETLVAACRDGAVESFTLTPESVGLPRVEVEAIRGGEPEENARALLALLDGAAGAYRDIVVLNAGAALLIAGLANDLESGMTLAAGSLDSGAARTALGRLVAIGREAA